jgi:hypothetical protein
LHVEVTAREVQHYHERRATEQSTIASSVWQPKSDWSPSDVEQWERARLIRERLKSALVARWIAKIDEEDVRLEYKAVVDEWWTRTVRYLRVPIPANADIYEQDEAYRKAQALFERARGGEDVCQLVKQYGDTNCGLRGPGDNGILHPAVIQTFHDGEVLPPRHIPGAFQVVQVLGPAPPSLDEARAMVKARVEAKTIQREGPRWFLEQWQSAKIEYRRIEDSLFFFEEDHP